MDLIFFIVAAVVGLLPAIALYKWILKKNNDEKIEEIYKKSFKSGITSIFPIILVSLTLHVIGKLSNLEQINPLLYQFYYKFIVLAFAEELVKFLIFKKIIKKAEYNYSWFNLTIIMTLIGLGFECIETVILAIGSNIITMIIRGISLGHAGYGFIMGWFYGKMKKTKKKIYGILSFLIPLTLHGLYDFGLTNELIEANDTFAILPISLEIVCLVCAVLIIRFVRKRKDSDIYIEE